MILHDFFWSTCRNILSNLRQISYTFSTLSFLICKVGAVIRTMHNEMFMPGTKWIPKSLGSSSLPTVSLHCANVPLG